MTAGFLRLRRTFGGGRRGDGVVLPRDAKLLTLGIFFAIAATNVLTPLLPDITVEFRISYSTAGLIVTSYVVARLIASVFVGWAANRFGRIPLAIAAIIALVTGSLVGLFAPNVEALVISRLVMGTGTGVIATLALVTLSDLSRPRNRAQVMSLFQIAHNGGIALYPIIGGLIGLVTGWRATFVVMAVAAVLSGLVLLPVFRRATSAASMDGEDRSDVYPDSTSNQRRAIGIGAVLAGVFATMFNRHGFRNTLLPLYAGAVLGLGPVAIATGITAMSLVGLVIAMPGAVAGDLWGYRRVITMGLFALALGDLTFLLTGNYVSFLLAATALGLGDFFLGSQTALLSSMATRRQRTQVLGGFRFATDAGAIAGPLALAALMDAIGPQSAMIVAASLLMLAAAISRFAIPARVPPQSVGDEDPAVSLS